MRSLQQFWSVRRIGEDKVTLARLGPLRLWLARAEQEWGFATHYGEETDLMDFAKVPEDVVPDDLTWTYAYFQSAPRDYVFEALPPQVPILFNTRNRIGIPSGEICRFYFAVPAGIAIRLLEDGRKRELGEIHSAVLKQSWFGSTVKGTLCRANRTGIALQADNLDPRPNEIIFSLEICNHSKSMIWPQKVCLDLRPAGLYCDDDHLLGGRIQLEVEHPQSCRIRFLGPEPKDGQDLLELRVPSETERSDLLHKVLCCCQDFKHN